jgi:ATP-dependent DNA helicase RecQ
MNKPLPDGFLQVFRDEFLKTRVKSNWDKFTLHTLEAVIIEFFKKEAQQASTFADLVQFIEEFARRDDGQLNKIYQLHREEISKHHPEDVARTEIILTTMHRVKGLEYDVVLIPSSYSDLSVRAGGNMSFEDMLYEERRLWYVAMTRAKKRLVWIVGQREFALTKNEVFVLPDNERQEIGVGFEDGIDKLNLGYLSWDRMDEMSFRRKMGHIEHQIRIGDAIRLMPTTNGGTSIWHNAQLIGMLRNNTLNCPPNGMSGYVVTGVLRYTYQDCLDYDRRNGANFAQNWNASARQQGYVSIVDFAGYGR